MKYLWAAYRKNTWSDIPAGLEMNQFTRFIATLCDPANLMVIEAPNKYAVVGLVSCREDRFYLEPHVDWLPWATKRNKLEGVARIILDLKKIKTLLVLSKEDTKEFFTHMCRYGILRRIGTFNGQETLALFQSMEK